MSGYKWIFVTHEKRASLFNLYKKNTIMKKMIIGGVAAIVIAVLAGVNVNLNSQSENLLSDLALANVEALASGEGGGGTITYQCWQTVTGSSTASYLIEKTYCLTCTALPTTSWSSQSVCRK
jgi:hypothetical protein